MLVHVELHHSWYQIFVEQLQQGDKNISVEGLLVIIAKGPSTASETPLIIDRVEKALTMLLQSDATGNELDYALRRLDCGQCVLTNNQIQSWRKKIGEKILSLSEVPWFVLSCILKIDDDLGDAVVAKVNSWNIPTIFLAEYLGSICRLDTQTTPRASVEKHKVWAKQIGRKLLSSNPSMDQMILVGELVPSLRPEVAEMLAKQYPLIDTQGVFERTGADRVSA